MPFQDLVDDVNDLCVEGLGESASLTDGTTTLAALQGFFRPNWEETLSGQYGFVADAPTFECKAADLAAVDLTKAGTSLKLTYGGRVYVVGDHRRDHGMTLLVLAR